MNNVLDKVVIALSILVIICSLLMYVVGDGTTPAWQPAAWAFTTLIAYIRFKRMAE